MNRLMMLIFSIASPTLMGVAVIAALVAGFVTLKPILIAALVGFILSIPISWQVARAIS